MEKLNINLFPESVSESKYEKARLEFIASYQEYVHTFLGGSYESRPDVGEAKWNEMYPDGYSTWAGRQRSLTAYGEQTLVDKVNELVEAVNKLTKKKK